MNDIYKAPEASLETDSDNNSGMGKEIVVPEGIAGWSWGAFFFSWIWAIGNKTWIGLFALVPYVGFIMSITLGIKGREWAWKNKHWESIEHFNKIQRRWSLAALVFLVIILLGITAAVIIPMMAEQPIN